MTASQFHEDYGYGSARFAQARKLHATGLFQLKLESIFCGFHSGKSLWYSGAGGVVLVVSSRLREASYAITHRSKMARESWEHVRHVTCSASWRAAITRTRITRLPIRSGLGRDGANA